MQIKKIVTVLCLFLSIFFGYNIEQVLAEERTFLDLKLEFLGQYNLTTTEFNDTRVGGLSGITYDAKKDVFYAISDDRSYFAPARFYTLKIDIQEEQIKNINIENVTFLKDENKQFYLNNTIDTEAIALSPRNTLFISSEGVADQDIPPFINEYNLDGDLLNSLPIPNRYIPSEKEKKGIQNNFGFESLTIKANGTIPEDPFRLFTMTESALLQDIDPKNSESILRSRLMHYVVNPFGNPVLVGEHLYIMDNPDLGVLYQGVSDLLALPQEGYLLSLERTFGLRGFGLKIYQLVVANASDISTQKNLPENVNNVTPIKKKLLLNLQDLGIKLDNLEGITLGSIFPDGSQSLILISDNNFGKSNQQTNQFLLFKIR